MKNAFLPCLFLSALPIVAGCHGSGTRFAMADLHHGAAPLRDRFNAEKDRPRIIALFSPT